MAGGYGLCIIYHDPYSWGSGGDNGVGVIGVPNRCVLFLCSAKEENKATEEAGEETKASGESEEEEKPQVQ